MVVRTHGTEPPVEKWADPSTARRVARRVFANTAAAA